MLPVWDLENRFTLHSTTPTNTARREQIRRVAHSYATLLNELVPDGREKEQAINRLEEVVFWANAGIARTQGGS